MAMILADTVFLTLMLVMVGCAVFGVLAWLADAVHEFREQQEKDHE